MAVGDRHEFSDGYRFWETLHGPCVERLCVDCGAICYGTPECPEPRCSKCGRRLWGLSEFASTRSRVGPARERTGV
jgi:hypothetical protein